MGKKIYHYTKDAYLKNIMSTKKLRATASTQSNDLMDTIYISKLLEGCCDQLISNVVNKDISIQSNEKQIISNTLNVLLIDLFYKG